MIDLGDVVVRSINVRNSAGALANAGSVVATITLPDGTTATPSVVNTSTGVYTITYTPTLVGFYRLRWVATGSNANAYGDAFVVADGSLSFLDLSTAKAFLNITSTTNDDELRDFIQVATACASEYSGLQLAPVAVEETHDGCGQHVWLRKPKALSVTTVVESGATLAADDYSVRHGGQALLRRAGSAPGVWLGGIDAVTVTYFAGVQGNDLVLASHAVKQMLKHLWSTQRGSKRAPTADEWESGSGYTFPTRVTQLLDPIRVEVGIG